MANYLEDDEEDTGLGLQPNWPGSPPPDALPVSGSMSPMLASYLQKVKSDDDARMAKLKDPGFQEELRAPENELQKSSAINNFLAGLSRSTNNIGAGASQGATGLETAVSGLNKQNAMSLQGAQKDRASVEKGLAQSSLNPTIARYLAQKDPSKFAFSPTPDSQGRFLRMDKTSGEVSPVNDLTAGLTPGQKSENDYRQRVLDLKTKESNRKDAEDASKKKMPDEIAQKTISSMQMKNAQKISVKTQLDADLAQMKKAMADKNIDQAIAAGQSMFKTLNSPEGSDAVGEGEAQRIGSMLKYHIFNFTDPGAFFGRDIPGFMEQVQKKSDSLAASVIENDRIAKKMRAGMGMEDILAGKPADETEASPGSATAAPATGYKHEEGYDWALKNPQDPVAKQILERLKKKGFK